MTIRLISDLHLDPKRPEITNAFFAYLDRIQSDTSALYILGEDPVMSDPDTKHIRANLEACDFVILQEIFKSETAV